MTADYAEPLKRAWDRMASHPLCGEFCRKSPCLGHAALLEMVEEYSKRINPDDHPLYLKHEQWGKEERRRLRAAVGVNND